MTNEELERSICKNCYEAIVLLPGMHFGQTWVHSEADDKTNAVSCYGVSAEPPEDYKSSTH